MSVQPLNPFRAAVSTDWGKGPISSERTPTSAPTMPATGDRAIVSNEARQLAAGLAAAAEALKLHLSPQELRQLVSPPEPRGVVPSTSDHE